MGAVRLGSYLEELPSDLAPTVGALHRAVLAVRPDLEVSLTLGMLTYALDGDLRHWVCSIGASADVVILRFLVGSYMRDPELRLKSGIGDIRSIDFDPREVVDDELVRTYVTEALVQLPAYKQR